MPALTPTVHERVARCNTRVPLTGLTAGAQVILSVDGTEYADTATGGALNFDVPPLDAGQVLRARQDDGAGFTPWSAPVVVENVQLPPVSTPQLPEEVGSCSQCVRLTGLVPGCEIEVLEGGVRIGFGRANRHGAVCIGIKRPPEKRRRELCARMIVCGEEGPLGCTPFAEESPLGPPQVGSPIYGCQRTVTLSALHRGARTKLETRDPLDPATQHGLGSICNCWTGVNVRVHEDLKTDWQVRARQYWNSDACDHESPWSAWRDIVPPDEGIRPTVLPMLVDGDPLIRVDNQILGGELMVLVRDGAEDTDPVTEYGPRPASDALEISLNEELAAGQFVAVSQTLCGHREVSDWVEVMPGPVEVFAPNVQEPLFECAGSALVSGLYPGATVRVYADGFPIGLGWAGASSSLAITVLSLNAGQKITARQWVGVAVSPESTPVTVQSKPEIHRPRILEPVALGDRRVWVSGVTPGCRVSVWSGGLELGETDAAEPIVSVPVEAVPGPVQARARLCTDTATSATVEPIADPGATGRLAVGQADEDYGTFNVPEHSVTTPHQTTPDGNFSHPVRGRVYFPATASGAFNTEQAWPLVIVAHGYQSHFNEEELQSPLGYAWLARHLASWGMVVFSIDLVEVNARTDTSPFQQSARGEIVLKAIEELLADPRFRGRIDVERIGLVGHSMGGEGVVVAQALNQMRADPFSIQGVVSIAPTQYRPDIELKNTRYLQLIGSLDLLLSGLSVVTGNATGDNPRYGSWRIYDRAGRPKTHLWIYRARHDGFNTNWWTSTLSPEPSSPEELTLAQHQHIGRSMINAFFQDAFGDTQYGGYLAGPVRPQGLYGFEIFPQHHARGPQVVDDFGDAAGVLDKTTNAQGQSVAIDGLQLVHWEDIEHTTLAHSVHDTKSTELEWKGPDAGYSTPLGSVSVPGMGVLSLRAAQFYDEDGMGDPIPETNPVGIPADLFLELTTTSGSATVRGGIVGEIPYPYARSPQLSVMRTLRIPRDAFEAVAPGGTLGTVVGVRLWMGARPTGRVLVDDVEVTL